MNSTSVRESRECETFQFKTFCVTRSIKMGQSQNVSYSIAIAQTEFMTHFYKNKIDKESIVNSRYLYRKVNDVPLQLN